jgi:hypothetical protein
MVHMVAYGTSSFMKVRRPPPLRPPLLSCRTVEYPSILGVGCESESFDSCTSTISTSNAFTLSRSSGIFDLMSSAFHCISRIDGLVVKSDFFSDTPLVTGTFLAATGGCAFAAHLVQSHSFARIKASNSFLGTPEHDLWKGAWHCRHLSVLFAALRCFLHFLQSSNFLTTSWCGSAWIGRPTSVPVPLCPGLRHWLHSHWAESCWLRLSLLHLCCL